MKTSLRKAAATLLLPLLIVPVGSAAVAEAGATAWEAGVYSRARLIAGAAGAGDEMLAGVHVQLHRGWQTYWRSPGDSGLPPRFDWSKSQNLKEARVLWPAPRRFRDQTGAYAGYSGEVVFPVLLKPERAGAPIELNLTLHYAICKDLCVPEQAELSLRVPPSAMTASAAPAAPAMSGRAAPASYDALISRYLKRVPARAGGEGQLPRVRQVTAVLDSASPKLVVEAEFPAGAEGADLFVEGPEGFYFPAPEAHSGPAPGLVRFTVDLNDSREPGRLTGETLTLTLVSDLARAEARWTLD